MNSEESIIQDGYITRTIIDVDGEINTEKHEISNVKVYLENPQKNLGVDRLERITIFDNSGGSCEDDKYTYKGDYFTEKQIQEDLSKQYGISTEQIQIVKPPYVAMEKN